MLANLLGEIIDDGEEKMLIKARTKEQKALDKEDFKDNPDCNNII